MLQLPQDALLLTAVPPRFSTYSTRLASGIALCALHHRQHSVHLAKFSASTYKLFFHGVPIEGWLGTALS